MNNIDYEKLSDEEFHKMFEEFDKKIDIFLEKEDFYTLNSIEVVRTSKDKIKEHLKNKYKLELIDEDNLTFKEL